MRTKTYEEIPKIPLCMIGHGGQSRVIGDIAAWQGMFRIAAVADDKYAVLEEREGVFYGPLNEIRSLLETNLEMMVVIAIGDNRTRRKVMEELALPSERYAVLIHPTAILSSKVSIGAGTVIMPGAIVNHGAVIGKQVIINSGAIVEHDNVIDDFAHLSPRAALAGAVHVMEGAHIGIGAVVIPGIRIGKWSILGAGAAAIRHIPEGVTAVGVPARTITHLTAITG